MIRIRELDASALTADYARKGFAVIPQFVSGEVAAFWELETRSLPGKKVHVGREYGTKWLEQKVATAASALDGLGDSDQFVNLVAAISGLEAIDRYRTRVWINRYSPGDHVPSHCDRAGSTQCVLCLQGLPEPEKGGELFIGEEVIPLCTGDAVLFFARGVSHGTVSIGSEMVGPSGFSRVTCVIRFFAPNHLDGASA
jgi:hypothetical protein